MSSALTPLPHRAASSPGRTSPPYSNESCGIVRVRSHAAGPGEIYPLPLPGSSGAPLRPLVRPQHVPVYVAAMGPHNLRSSPLRVKTQGSGPVAFWPRRSRGGGGVGL
jgi:hypothetical protein